MADAAELHISGLVLRARPERLAAVTDTLQRLPGAEAVAHDARGKLALTLETGSEQALLDVIARLERLPGVLNVALVYHHHEPAGDLAQEIVHEDHPT
jgi:nitrate reductase NapD